MAKRVMTVEQIRRQLRKQGGRVRVVNTRSNPLRLRLPRR